MRVEFTAFAEDAVFGGNIALEADRLSDVIGEDSQFEINDVVLVALEDGRKRTVSAVTISRIDFAAITASGPRGNALRRVPTRQHPVRTRIGPYEIVGYLHAPPSAHTLWGIVRRRILPLTSATIRYRLNAQDVEERFDGLLLNGDRVTWVEAATSKDLGMGAVLDMPRRIGRTKDLTGGISG
jgi:hypothetical protein